MKRVIVLVFAFFVLVGTIGCRSYLVQPIQIAVADEEFIEKLRQFDCFQNMNFTIKVEGVDIQKSIEAKAALK